MEGRIEFEKLDERWESVAGICKLNRSERATAQTT